MLKKITALKNYKIEKNLSKSFYLLEFQLKNSNNIYNKIKEECNGNEEEYNKLSKLYEKTREDFADKLCYHISSKKNFIILENYNFDFDKDYYFENSKLLELIFKVYCYNQKNFLSSKYLKTYILCEPNKLRTKAKIRNFLRILYKTEYVNYLNDELVNSLVERDEFVYYFIKPDYKFKSSLIFRNWKCIFFLKEYNIFLISEIEIENNFNIVDILTNITKDIDDIVDLYQVTNNLKSVILDICTKTKDDSLITKMINDIRQSLYNNSCLLYNYFRFFENLLIELKDIKINIL